MPDKSLKIDELKLVAFDWDNTLALTREILVKSINQILPLYNLPEWDIVKNWRDCNLSFRDNFPLIFKQNAEEAYEKYRAVYKEYALKMLKKPLFAEETILFLRKAGIKIAIVSNKDRKLLEFELPLIYKADWFDKIVCGHEATKDKPNPEQLLYAIPENVAEITPQTVWMVGDSPMDSRCAILAGAKAIRVGQPIWNNVTEEENYDNTIFFSDFSHLYQEIIKANAN